MRQQFLGQSDVQASVVGLGTWVTGGWMWGGTDDAGSIRAIHQALDLGMNLIGPDRVFTGDDMRRENGRFRPENLRKIAPLLDDLRPVADRRRLTLGQLAIAWTIARAPVTHVLVGARTAAQIRENAPAADAQLTPDDLAAIHAALHKNAAQIP